MLIAICVSSIQGISQSTHIFEEWIKSTAEQGFHYKGFTASDAAGNIYLTGSTLNADGDYDVLIEKYSKKGTLLWNDTIQGASQGDDVATNLVLDTFGYAYVAGSVYNGVTQGNDFLISKYSPTGTEVWRSTYDNGGNDDVAADIALDNSGSVFITGGTYDTNTQL